MESEVIKDKPPNPSVYSTALSPFVGSPCVYSDPTETANVESEMIVDMDTLSPSVYRSSSGSKSDEAVPFVVLDEEDSQHVFDSPNGTRFWYPIVSEDLKPTVGMKFSKWVDVFTFYETYAEKSGFSVRIGTVKRCGGVITHRYLLCNKAGKPQYKRKFDSMNDASLNVRKDTFKVCNCNACIKVKVCKSTGCYVVYDLVENHNHMLVASYNKDLTKKGRRLDFSSKQFIHQMSMNKVGPAVAHRLQVTLKGGHHNVRGTPSDYKNFSRSIKTFIGERDAQLFLDKLRHRAEHLPNFSFEFLLEKGELRNVFWADEIAKINYKAFGEVLAFDATYQTNKYNMIFVPFTGVDNHKRCVTFGAGLLFNETIESYCWLLNCFLKAHGTQPSLVLTDQDPAMRQAVSLVFHLARHRLCMWHIMKKLPSKISGDVLHNTEARASIHKLVWNVYIKPETFESRWQKILDTHGLTNNDWLVDMYAIRELWVPAYFRDIQMCCLMKTTSRCESSNSAFKVNSSWANTLVQFLLCFDATIDGQRYNQRLAEFKTVSSSFDLLTGLPIEKHASYIYSHAIFDEVRKEIQKGMLFCYISTVKEEDGVKVYTITHLDKRTNVVNDFTVRVDELTDSVSCSCRGWTRIGYLCRHVFCVFRYTKVQQIPEKYVLARWRRDVLPKAVFNIGSRYGVDNSQHTVVINDLQNMFTECVNRLREDLDGLELFRNEIKAIKENIFEKVSQEVDNNKDGDVIAHLLGHEENVDVTCSNPRGIRNKGCGTNRRLIGPGEKAVEKKKKAPRLCRTCGEYTDHDSRNCPLKVHPSDD